jgi:hypothetical protein
MCSFIDSDSDGIIAPEDILMAEARIRQRNPDFLKIIFRVYVDAVWYPGRNLNQANAYLSGMVGSWAAGVKNVIQGTETSGTAIFEPPKFITGIWCFFSKLILKYMFVGKNVSFVFEKLGYGSEAGLSAFNALCEAIQRKRQTTARARFMSGTEGDIGADGSDSGHVDADPDLPITAPVAAGAADSGASASDFRMDFNEFIEAAVDFDDILVQAVLFSSRKRMLNALKDGGQLHLLCIVNLIV